MKQITLKYELYKFYSTEYGVNKPFSEQEFNKAINGEQDCISCQIIKQSPNSVLNLRYRFERHIRMPILISFTDHLLHQVLFEPLILCCNFFWNSVFPVNWKYNLTYCLIFGVPYKKKIITTNFKSSKSIENQQKLTLCINCIHLRIFIDLWQSQKGAKHNFMPIRGSIAPSFCLRSIGDKNVESIKFH